MKKFRNFDPVTSDLSEVRCDISGIDDPGKAAATLHAFLVEVAKATRMPHPQLRDPEWGYGGGSFWSVVWEDCDWHDWSVGVCGGEGEAGEGWGSLRNGFHFEKPSLGPFIKHDNSNWYLESYYRFDVRFIPMEPST